VTARADKVGVFGGTFDPIHRGHVGVARKALRTVGLDRVLLVPAEKPPHKLGRPRASFSDRLAMVRLAVRDEEGLRASDVEGGRKGPSYTVDTLRKLRKSLGGGVELHLLLGIDSVPELGTWHDVEGLFAGTRFIIAGRPGFPRPGAGATIPGLRPGQVEALRLSPFLETRWDVSSTRIRERAGAGGDVSEWVGEEVAAYIAARGLYRGKAERLSRGSR
jgi:nicotinate-nucleotide adenylyltransferase